MEKRNESNCKEEYCINHNDNEHNAMMQNRGCVDSIKNSGSARLFYANPKGFGPDIYDKTKMLMQSKELLQFDGAIFSSLDRLWNSR